MAQIYFSSLIITQRSFLIYSLCSFEALSIPFNFQYTIFSAKMQYNRLCKFSRPWLYMLMMLLYALKIIRVLIFGNNLSWFFTWCRKWPGTFKSWKTEKVFAIANPFYKKQRAFICFMRCLSSEFVCYLL